MNKNILICLEQIGIGGVETAVINKAIAFKQKGYNVVIVAKNGIYREKIEENGIKYIDFEFKLGDYFDIDGINKIIDIIDEYDIGQVHIHQYTCLPYACMACICTNIPYIIYIHGEIIGTCEWFMKSFKVQEAFLKTCFENAYKIVAITKTAVKKSMRFFSINDEEKYIIEKNSINFEEYKAISKVEKIQRFLIVARLAEEKYPSIKNAIDLFLEYAEINKDDDLVLNIVGDGDIKEKLQEYVEEKNQKKYTINFCGQSSDVKKYIEESDIVVAIGRCVLEAIAMKRIAVISGIKNLKCIVNETNIENAMLANFTGRPIQKDENTVIPEMEDLDAKELAYEISKITKEEIDHTVNYNYNVICKYLDIKNNSYCIEHPQNKIYKDFLLKILNQFNIKTDCLNEITNLNNEKNNQEKNLNEEINFFKKQCESNQQDLSKKQLELQEKEKIINKIETDYMSKENELNNVLNSKRWRLISKVANLKNKIYKKTKK